LSHSAEGTDRARLSWSGAAKRQKSRRSGEKRLRSGDRGRAPQSPIIRPTSVGRSAFHGFSGTFNCGSSTFSSGIDCFTYGCSGISGNIASGSGGITSSVYSLSTCISGGIDCTFRGSGSSFTGFCSSFTGRGSGITRSSSCIGGGSTSLRGFLLGFLGARTNDQCKHGNRQRFEHRVECFHEHLRFGRRKNNRIGVDEKWGLPVWMNKYCRTSRDHFLLIGVLTWRKQHKPRKGRMADVH
jgi:hypothetical protein